MKVELIDHTHDALNLLLRTKNTRLAYERDPDEWTDEERREHLAYMLGTIKSSWEFVSYTFRITGVTRAFTHQLVRSRQGSYAQESQRTVNVSDHDVLTPEMIEDGDESEKAVWDGTVAQVMDSYNYFIAAGVAPQDARGILPTNISTNIIAKFNLRTLHEMAKVRLCVRTQGEYQNVFREMRNRVIEVHDWAEPFIRVACAADGVCAFPAYRECPIKPGLFDPDNGGVYGPDGEPEPIDEFGNRPKTKGEQQEEWERMDAFEATPVSKNGRTM